MISVSINVKYLYFEYKELTPLHGELAFNTLQKLLSWMKENASSVPRNLGKGRHGCIWIILSIASYATLDPLTPFLLLIPPGILTVLAGSTQYEIALQKNTVSWSPRWLPPLPPRLARPHPEGSRCNWIKVLDSTTQQTYWISAEQHPPVTFLAISGVRKNHSEEPFENVMTR